MCSANLHLINLRIHRPLTPYSRSFRSPIFANVSRSGSIVNARSPNHNLGFLRSQFHNLSFLPSAMDDDFMDGSLVFDEGDDGSGLDPYYMMYSSGDESDTDMMVNSVGDYELPLSEKRHGGTPEGALNVTVHRFGEIQRGHRKRRRTQHGVMINMGLIAFLALFLSFVDWCSWKIVRLPLEPFFLTQPFSLSTVMAACAGCIFVPIADSVRIQKMLREHGPARHSHRKRLPTLGGLFFIPIGLAIARSVAGISSVQVNAAALATLTFAAIGLFGDVIKFNDDHSYRRLRWITFFLKVAAGTWFSFWLYSVDMPTPYKMKFLVPLPPPHGIAYLGKYYLVMTTFSFVAMGNGLNLADRLDGLVGGVSALAFIGMSVAVLPICPDLAIFGASMAGACIGFLFHNRYKASILMGDIGSLALGGALAAMAACTGMFLPLFISSGIFALEMLSVIIQALFVKSSQFARRPPPLHYHLKLWGLKTPVIVASAYALSGILAVFAGYVGLISA
ncbi:phospho-N-acetylmuramoyl-pentapeptide-transferase homolog [Asparagus officinalis]|uniref:phospho-N-acetylmuramoyl-pentapeptide- transferase homolog n=1 Tax=Asparagus officinalis TaxID=4686 RepID=UPI00098E4B89|nr:phospho-N-acetylmuramoyl-pentapeptide-transferase homolog [Asparagus officinalis]